jgi:hypothetical protein
VEFEQFLEILRVLHEQEVAYILVGGVAVNLHGIIRATEDIGFFVRPEPENVERLKRALRSVWDDPDIDTFSAADFAGAYPTLRYAPPGSSLIIDIITRLGTKYRYDDLEFEVVETGGVPVRVATAKTLIKMKQATLRPIDRADAEALSRRLDRGESD